jgi:hypothetical protein
MENRAWPVMEYKSGQGRARQGKARQGKTGQGKTGRGRAGQGVRSLLGRAWRDRRGKQADKIR